MLSCSIGQHSSAGAKATNQDSYGACCPSGSHLTTKGIAIALSDGISSSEVSHIASQSAIKSFLEDYYCTSETWTVKTAAQRVLHAHNSWLFAQNQRNHHYRLNKDKGYVATFSALLIKSNTAHILHVGDAQVYRLRAGKLEPLVEPHRVWISADKSYLSRALGITQQLDIDYLALPIELSDVFILATDGVYEFVRAEQIQSAVEAHTNDLDLAAQKLVELAQEQGSDDNLTAQVVCIDSLPTGGAGEYLLGQQNLPFPPALNARMIFDGFEIVRDLHRSARSQVWLAKEIESKALVALKVPSTEGRESEEYLERFLMEEWIARRLNNPQILKAHAMNRRRNYCYTANEYVKGQSLAQWMIDNPSPSVEQVRQIIEQIAKGLYALHRQEMLHQDLRPNNVMIDHTGTVKIIDFGSTLVSGIQETQNNPSQQVALGTAQFLAPEYFLGELGTRQSDLYSLACIAYHMLCGRSPYGANVARSRTRADQHRLIYQSVIDNSNDIPAWVDLTLKRALQISPQKRYAELSEFMHDLRKPNPKFLSQTRAPLIEQNPVRFWQGLCLALCGVIAMLLWQLTTN